MDDALCFYSIVRFLPFAETQEFANVGIVLWAPRHNALIFRLQTRRYKRITDFFERVDGTTFRRIMREVQHELRRVSDQFGKVGSHRGSEAVARLWEELLKPKSTQVVFGPERLVLADNPQERLQELFSRYVERDFVTREYAETTLKRQVAGWLQEANLAQRFQEARIGNEAYSATFPFVSRDGQASLRVIKPLALTQADATAITEHGGMWVLRLSKLREHRLQPEHLLFPYDGDHREDSLLGQARRDVLLDLERLGAQTIPASERRVVLEFAGA